MSFGFSVGDFIAVLALANQLYQNVYKVARTAPNELEALEKDLGAFAQSMNLLVEEIKNPDSLLNQAGSERVRMVVEFKDQAKETLLKLQAIAVRHGLVKAAERPKLRKFWDRTRFLTDLSKINSLRARLLYHYNVMQLLLTSVGNSSLERLESETKTMAANTAQMMKLLTELSQRMQTANLDYEGSICSPLVGQLGPELIPLSPSRYNDLGMAQGASAPESKVDKLSSDSKQPIHSAISCSILQSQMTDEFMKMAEINTSWPTIGLNSWVQAGKWWLMRGQFAIRIATAQRNSIDCQGYTDLLKACWIMTYVIQEHPQRHLTLSKADRDNIKLIYETILLELEKLRKVKAIVPTLEEVLSSDLNIWPRETSTELQLQPRYSKSRREIIWSASRSPLLFQRFGLFASDCSSELKCVECLILTFYDRDAQHLRLVIQDAHGTDLLNTIHLDTASRAVFTLNGPRIPIHSSAPQPMSDTDTYTIYLFHHNDTSLLLGLFSSFELAKLFLMHGCLQTETLLSYFCLSLLASSRLNYDTQTTANQIQKSSLEDITLPSNSDPHRAKQYWFEGLSSTCEMSFAEIAEVCENIVGMLVEFQHTQHEPNRATVSTALTQLETEPTIFRYISDWITRGGQSLNENLGQQWKILTLLLHITPNSPAIRAHLSRLEQQSILRFAPAFLDLVCDTHIGSEGRMTLLRYLQITNIGKFSHFSRLLPELFCLLCNGVRISLETCHVHWVVLLVKSFHNYIIEGRRALLMSPLCVLFRERSFDELEATRRALFTFLKKSTSNPSQPKPFQIALKEILYIYMSAIIGSLPHVVYGVAAWPTYDWGRELAALDRMKPHSERQILEREKSLATRMLQRMKLAQREALRQTL